ncbi:MAG: hypothetical protein LBE03_00820 [Candidatus Nomurabacteria bacterium]|jgi:hypothetical protein|nr:hypothetical protein [Candidatus Nomurabacteria bacterium]
MDPNAVQQPNQIFQPQVGPASAPPLQSPIPPTDPNAPPVPPSQDPNKPETPAPPSKEATTTQTSLMISEIRDGMVVMKDGSFRAVVECESINFDLMSQMEREGVEYSYQGFLNSLNFTVQILVRSQRIDIGPYLEKLQDIRRNQDNMLLNVLIDDYIDFIDLLSQEANIMDKRFFVIIPYYTSDTSENMVEQSKGFFKKLFGGAGPTVTNIDKATFEKAVTEVSKRIAIVVDGLRSVGVSAIRLNTKALGTLYYNFNNPDTSVREPLVDFSKVTSMYIQKGDDADKGVK